MTQEYDHLLKCFDKAIEDKQSGRFAKDNVKQIYDAAHKVFDGEINLDQKQIMQVRDKWVKLAEGHIDKGRAMKKLQGTSRAEAIRSVLESML